VLALGSHVSASHLTQKRPGIGSIVDCINHLGQLVYPRRSRVKRGAAAGLQTPRAHRAMYRFRCVVRQRVRKEMHAMLAMVSTPRDRDKLNGHYLSSQASYVPEFRERVQEVTQGAELWKPQRG
jgi:hypothetical protein